jgi:hypothetical protein
VFVFALAFAAELLRARVRVSKPERIPRAAAPMSIQLQAQGSEPSKT